MKWFRHFLERDNSKVNTGTIFAALGCAVTLAVVVYNEFWLQGDCGTNNRYLLLGLIALGGWGYAASLRNDPPHKPPPKGDENG